MLYFRPVPPYTAPFAQLALASIMIESISKPLVTAQNATGKVRNYQLVVGGVQLLNLPLCYVALIMGMSPVSVAIVSIIVSVLTLAARLYMLPITLINFSRILFFKEVIIKCLIVSFIALLFPLLIYGRYTPGFLAFSISSLICILVSVITILYLGCSKSERLYFVKKLNNIIKK